MVVSSVREFFQKWPPHSGLGITVIVICPDFCWVGKWTQKMDSNFLSCTMSTGACWVNQPFIWEIVGWALITLSTCAADLFLNTICQIGTTAILVEYVSKRVECEEISGSPCHAIVDPLQRGGIVLIILIWSAQI